MSISRLALALALSLVAAAASAGELRGHVKLGVQGVALDDAGPVVVYLEGVQLASSSSTRPSARSRSTRRTRASRRRSW